MIHQIQQQFLIRSILVLCSNVNDMSEPILLESKQLDLNELKVAELKSELKKLGLSASGNKQELQEKLKNLNEEVEAVGEHNPKSPIDRSQKIPLKSDSLNEPGVEEETAGVAKNSEEVAEVKIELVGIKNEEDKENTKDMESGSERSESVIKEVPLSGERNRFSRSKSPKPRWHHNASEGKKIEDTCQLNEENDANSLRKRKWLGEDFLVNKKSPPTISSETLKSFLPKNPLDNLDKQNIKEDDELDDLKTTKSEVEHNSEHNEQRTSAIKESDNELDFEESVPESPSNTNEAEPQEAKSDSNQIDEKLTNVLHVSNLTRPFTLNQLKDLLGQYGKINEQHFWISSVKSNCYVEYESKEDAKSAKKNLHNIKWPSSNPKNLVCLYTTLDELMSNMNGALTLPNKHKDSENKEAKTREKDREKEREKEKEKEREKEPKSKSEKIREWDLPKLRQRSRSRDRRQKENSVEKIKENKEEESVKTFDDLFRKTTTTPFIYWLPLNEEQCAERQRENERRQMEREKRAEERRQREEAEKAQREKERVERLEKEEKERKAKEEERAKEITELENKRVEEKKEIVERTDKDKDKDKERERGRDISRERERARERDRHDQRRTDVGRYRYDRNEQYGRRTPPRYESDRYRGRAHYAVIMHEELRDDQDPDREVVGREQGHRLDRLALAQVRPVHPDQEVDLHLSDLKKLS
ncbi:apoptotic chromatin condensation inducer in the nucleus isoform X4 [Brachionus plicatilis]|uniref:Apoptotic chromatin condensation inducer in the nucleus isoform X4 n=1 Tax=Brachionus plicatilis TaxID=10195 RepID=A0A3M7S5G5_BRAPC|nr:apoptotic chromatin condensation inducer in the nucleus isoform X4 [Brachionus plicatilis]